MEPQATHLAYLRACLALAARSPPKPTNFRVGCILLYRAAGSPPSSSSHPAASASASVSASVDVQSATTAGATIHFPLGTDTILSTGYTLELPGNTHAEQCCLAKYAAQRGVDEGSIGRFLPPPELLQGCTAAGAGARGEGEKGGSVILYVTMEPCGYRLSGNMPCVRRIGETRVAAAADGKEYGRGRGGIDKVFFGVKEPGDFVGPSQGCRMLDEAGVAWEVVGGLEEEILAVAKTGHQHVPEQGAADVAAEGHEDGAAAGNGQGQGQGQGQGAGRTNINDVSDAERARQAALPRNPMKRMYEEP